MTSRGTRYWNTGAIPLIAPEILGDIIAQVADIAIVMSDAGIVLSVLTNPKHDVFRDLERWEGKDIRTTLTVESVPKFDNRLAEFLTAKKAVRPVELNHTDENKQWEFPVRYSFHHIGPDGTILILGQDLRPIAETQQQLVKAQLALERDYEIQRESDTRFRVLMNNMTEAAVFISCQSGDITDANKSAMQLFDYDRTDLIGQSFAKLFSGRKRIDLVEQLTNHAMSEQDAPLPIDMQIDDKKAALYPTLFRAAGERILLCRMLLTDANMRIDDLGQKMRTLYLSGPDAIVFTKGNGDILSANNSFLDLVELVQDNNLRGRNLADYLQRGSVDMKVMADNAARTGRMRLYTTQIAPEYGSPLSIETSVTQIAAGDTSIFAFVMRDTSRSDAGKSVRNPNSDESMRSVMALVGSAALKDIVAETTDVVEKMCIETAIELTMNNRVAAAEMLGLSRQSLYVKLRKFDLVNRDDAQ